jgi:hypothetical protein
MALVDALLSELRALLEPELVGTYLSGSLATGGFDRASDVDVVVATRREVRGARFTTLDTLHRRLARAGTWCATELECTYTSVSALRRFDPRHAVHAHIGRGPGERLELATFDEGWLVQCHILRTQGITITGPDPVTLIDPVSAGRLRDAMRALVAGWATSFLGNPEALGARGYQSYVVLSLGRIRCAASARPGSDRRDPLELPPLLVAP